jgi:sulfite dehydrogenase
MLADHFGDHMTTSPPNLVRRQLLAGGAGVLATAGLAGVSTAPRLRRRQRLPLPLLGAAAAKALPAYVSWKNPELMIQHTATP